MHRFILADLLVMAISLILDHYFNIPDFLSGTLQGFAIVIMIVAFIKKPRSQKTN